MIQEGYGAAVLFAIDESAPAGMLQALRTVLADELQARDVELLVVDDGLMVLRSVSGIGGAATREVSLPAGGTVAGRAFSTQQLTTGSVGADGVVVYVPVTVRAHRRGCCGSACRRPPLPIVCSAPGWSQGTPNRLDRRNRQWLLAAAISGRIGAPAGCANVTQGSVRLCPLAGW